MEAPNPEPTSKVYTEFPALYRNFNRLPEYTKSLRSIRDTSSFEGAYMAMWNGLLMHFDRKNNPELTAPLIEALNQDHEEGQSKVEQCWEKLKPVSAYPIFLRIKNSLSLYDYAPKVVSGWGKKDSNTLGYLKIWGTASEIFPNIYDDMLFNKAHASHNGPTMRMLDKQLTDTGREDLIGYTTALYLLETSRTISHDVVLGALDKWANPNIAIKLAESKEEYLTKLLKRAEIYHYFATVFGHKIRQKEEEIFGKDAEKAGALWRAMLFVRNKAPQDRLLSFRKDMMNLLLDKEYDKARFLVEELLASYPETMPKFVREQLDIEPEVLRELRVEEKLKKKKVKKDKQRKEEI